MTARRAQVLLVGLFVVSAVVRVVVGLDRQTPLYYPDEYIYTALARSIAETGFPSLRGSSSSFLSILGPYLMAPAWLIQNVSDAYHVAVSLGAIAFSAAVFPAYFLARRVGTTRGAALAVALLSVLVPDAAFTTTTLTEGFAYPLFLIAVLTAADAVREPTKRRQAVAVVFMAALCLLRIQFVALPVAFLAATLVCDRGQQRGRRQSYVVIGAVGAVAALALTAGIRFYGHLWNHWSALSSLGLWVLIELFVLAIAAGWVIVPAAVAGFVGFLRSPDRRLKAFALFAVFTIGAITLEAAYFDAIQQRVHERYVFYIVPLLAIPAMSFLASGLRGVLHTRVAYVLVAVAILVPALASFRDADPSQSPTMLALQKIGTGGYVLLWTLGLAVLALAVARLRPRSRVIVAAAAVVAGAVCILGTGVLLSYTPNAHPGGARNVSLYRLGVPSHAALVTAQSTDSYVLMKTLFWTRNADEVLVLGGAEAADGYGSHAVWFGDRGLVDRLGRPITGPFAFPLDTTVVAGGSTKRTWTERSPTILILGLNRASGHLATVSQVLAASSPVPRTLRLDLMSESGRKQLTFDCGGKKFSAFIGRSTVPIVLSLAPGGSRRCRISLTRGEAVDSDGSVVSGVRVTRLRVAGGRAS